MSDGQRILTIPRANSINAFTMGGIARDAGLSVDEFKKLALIGRGELQHGLREVAAHSS